MARDNAEIEGAQEANGRVSGSAAWQLNQNTKTNSEVLEEKKRNLFIE